MASVVLIPSYKPDQRLVELVQALSQTDLPRIVVIDDGSGREFKPVFEQVAHIARVDLLTHKVNQGKGAAMRTGLRHIAALPEAPASVITADADGQHSVADIRAVVEASALAPGTLILGSRQFDKDVPPKSMFGNTTTRHVLRLFFGLNIWDTQTGLRAIPVQMLPAVTAIPYDRYELELEMLLVSKRLHVPVKEIPIQTIYIEKNRGSHFRPIHDSARIYFMLFRRALAILAAILVDYLVFAVAARPVESLLIALLAARLLALLVCYILLRQWVRLTPDDLQRHFPGPALLALAAAMLTSALIPSLTEALPITDLAAKFLIELGIFLLIRLIFWWFARLPQNNSGNPA